MDPDFCAIYQTTPQPVVIIVGMLNPSLRVALLWAFGALAPAALHAQGSEIPIERCDHLPVVRARIGKTEVRFLLDTGATTVLNLKSFAGGNHRESQVTSWTGTAATSAREILVSELSIGNHRLHDLKLPA